METINYRVIVFSQTGNTVLDTKVRVDRIEHRGEILCLIKEKVDVLIVPANYSIIEKL